MSLIKYTLHIKQSAGLQRLQDCKGLQCFLFPLQHTIGLSVVLHRRMLIDIRCTYCTTAMQHREVQHSLHLHANTIKAIPTHKADHLNLRPFIVSVGSWINISKSANRTRKGILISAHLWMYACVSCQQTPSCCFHFPQIVTRTVYLRGRKQSIPSPPTACVKHELQLCPWHLLPSTKWLLLKNLIHSISISAPQINARA